jgi:hypothetical protein
MHNCDTSTTATKLNKIGFNLVIGGDLIQGAKFTPKMRCIKKTIPPSA